MSKENRRSEKYKIKQKNFYEKVFGFSEKFHILFV